MCASSEHFAEFVRDNVPPPARNEEARLAPPAATQRQEQKIRERIETFLSLPGDDALRRFVEQYPELEYLTGPVNTIHAGRDPLPGAECISERLYGQKHPEFDRTVIAVASLRWILEGKYEEFTECQPQDKKLSAGSFMELRALALCALVRPLYGAEPSPINIGALQVDAATLDALLTWLVIHDTGKSERLAQLAADSGGHKSLGHDAVLEQILSSHRSLLPSLERLSSASQVLIERSTAAGFHLGNLALGESVPASLICLNMFSQAELELNFLHSLCDISGASAHLSPRGSLVMNQRNFDECISAMAAARSVCAGDRPREAFDVYLRNCADLSGLEIETDAGRALTRLAYICGVAGDRAGVEILKTRYEALPQRTRGILEDEFKRCGIGDGLALVPYGAAAYLRRSLAVPIEDDPRREALSAALATLARALEEARIKNSPDNADGHTMVVLTGLLPFAKTPGLVSTLEIVAVACGSDTVITLPRSRP